MKKINLIEMLQGCSKRNRTTFRQPNPDGRTTVKRQSTDGQSQRHYTLGLMKYVAMITLLLTLACGQMWAASVAEGTYNFVDQTIGGATKFYKIDNGIYQYRLNAYTRNPSLGIQLPSGTSDGTGFAFHLASTQKVYIGIVKKSVKREVTNNLYVKTITKANFDAIEAGSNHSTTVTLTLGGSATLSADYTFAAIGSAKIEGATVYMGELPAGYYYAYGNSSNGEGNLYSISFGTQTLFLVPNDKTGDNAKFAIYYWMGATGYERSAWTGYMTVSPCNASTYSADIPKGYTKLIFVRLDPSGGINWDSKWNQTGNLTFDGSKDLFTWANGSWDGVTTTWSASTKYTISFAANGGSGSMSNVSSIACGRSVTLATNAYEKDGYTFAGWKTNVAVTANGESVAANGIVDDEATISNITSNITLTAQWNEDVACSATQPGTITKGTLSGCTLRLTAGGDPASNNTWYWQASSSGTSTSESGATKDVTSTGTYYIRSYCSDGSGCWSDAQSVTVSASDLTPAAPTNFTAGSITAGGATFSITDAGNASSYDIYYSTSSTAPTSGTSATTTSTSKSKAVTGLGFNTTYYAWVRAVCGSNKSSWVALNPDGDSHTFTTSNTAPSSAAVNPSNGWIYVPEEEIELTASATASTIDSRTTYTWYKGSTLEAAKAAGAIQAASTSGSTYTIASCVAADANKYWCEISNGTGYESSASYDIKIYTFFLYSNTGSSISSHTFSSINRSDKKISVTVALSNTNYNYQFKVSDGLGTWYGKNSSTITGSTNYCDGLNSTGANVVLTSSFADDYTIDYYYNSNNVVVTYPVHNQTSGKSVYFDNSLTEMENIYLRIGHDANSSASSAFTLVPGTANLYVGSTVAFDNFHAWSIADNTGWTGTNTIYQPWQDGGVNKPDDDYAITKQTNYQQSVVDGTISIIPTSENNDEYGCQYYNVNKVTGMKTDRVTISSYSNGTITVNYVNTSGSATSFTSGYADVAHTCKLTSITAVPATGYEIDDDITINEDDYEANYVVTGATTVAASFKPATYSVTLNKNGGTINAGNVTSYTYLTGATLPTDVTRSGYRFMGWYADDEFEGDRVYSIGTSEYGNKTYWAKWAQLYAITDGEPSNGSLAITDGSSAITEAIAGETVYIVATPSTGYVFDEWNIYKTSDDETTVSPAAATASTSFSMPAYAVTVDATFAEVTYSLSYDKGEDATGSASGGTAAGSYTEGTTITVPAKGTLTNEDYTFRGWTDGTTFYLAGQSFSMPASDVTVSAVWEGGSGGDCTEYEVLLSDASIDRESSTAPKGDYITGRGMIMYNATGSSNASLNTGQTACHSSTTNFQTSGSKFAVKTFNAINKLTVYAVPGGNNRTISAIKTATATNSYSSDISSTCTLNQNMTTSGSCGETSIEFPNTLAANTYVEITFSGNIKVHGVLFENCTSSNYTVSFANMTGFEGSTTLPSSIVGVPTGKKILQPSDPEASGYEFGGWYSDAACTAGNEINWSTMTITADKTIYARWCVPHTVAWEVNGETYTTGTPTTATTDCDGISTMPTAPADNTLSCANSFRGWTATNLYGEATNTQPADLFVTAADAPTINADKTFYAVFGTATDKAYVGTVLWSENWTGESNNAKPSGPTTGGGYAIASGVEYDYTDGTGDNKATTKVATGTNAGGVSPELMVGYGTTTAGAFTVTGLPKKGAKELTLIFKRNNSTTVALTPSVTGEGYSISKVSGSGAGTYVYTITCGAGSTFDLTFTGSTTKDKSVRIDDIVLKVKTDGATNYRCICPSLEVTEKLVTASTPIFITSTASKTVRSQDSLVIVGTGLKKNATLSISSPASKFALKSGKNGALTTDATGAIDTVAYIYYTPGEGDTSDGLDKNNNFTITDGVNEVTINTALIGRHLPADFVIAAKNGDKWYALPADKANGTHSPVEITVDDSSDPTTATTSEANVFTLHQQTSTVITGGNGQYVKLAMHGQSNAPLKGDASGTGIGKGKGTNIDNDQDVDYWWALTQKNTSITNATDAKYNISVANGNPNNPLKIRQNAGGTGVAKWGLYSSASNIINEIRLLTWVCADPAAPTISGTTSYSTGETITLTASHEGSNQDAMTSYTWYKGATFAGAVEVQAAAKGSAGYTLTIASCTPDDAGTYWCEASNGTCTANSTGYTIDVPTGDHTLTWNLNVNTAESSIGTASKTSTTSLISNSTDMSNIGNYGSLTITSSKKEYLTSKIETPASYDADKYMYVTFTVPTNYDFVPTNISVKAQPVSTNKDVKLIMTDGVRTITKTQTNLSSGGITTVTETNAGGTAFIGTVTLKIYCYGATDAYRLGSPITIDGEVNYVCPERPTITSPTMPQSIKLYTDQNKTLSVSATAYSSGTLNYQWKKDGDNIVGATSASYTVVGSTLTAGTTYVYTCDVDQTSPASCAIVTSPAFNVTAASTECGDVVIAGVTATSKNSGTPEGSLIASSSGYKVNLQDWASPDEGCGTGGKIGGDNNYIYLTLKSGEYFQDGDKVIVDIAKVPGTGDSKLHIYDGTTTLSDESTMIGTSGTPTCGENEIVLSGVPANTSSITLHRGNGPTSATIQNPYVISMKVYRYGCPDIFIFDNAAETDSWSDEDNWIGPAGHGSGLPTDEDRVFINESVTVDTEDAAAAELHITNGSMVTVEKSITMGDVIIETGSTLNIAKDGVSGITVATNSLHLKGGWNDSYTEYDMPRVYIDPLSTLTKEVNTVNFDISVDQRNYYPFALPFDVVLNTDENVVDYVNPLLASYSNYGPIGQYVIKEYDGDRRANYGPDRENNWKVVAKNSTLKAGKGYIMTAVSLPAYGGGVIRFPMSFTNAWTALGEQGTVSAVTKNVVAVTAYEKEEGETKNANKGWNMLGVPFMSCYATSAAMYADEGSAAVMQGKYDFNTGNWTEDDIRYVSVPMHDFSSYIQRDITESGTILLPGWCFFIQIAESGNLTFLTTKQADESALPIYAPKRETANLPVEKTGIVLSGGDESDQTTILVSDKYSSDYEINADLEKMFGSGYTLATYSLSGSTRLAYNAMSKNDATSVIPIGYRAPADGEYTFSINPRYAENGAFQRVDLIDYQEGTLTNLLNVSYTFSTARTQNDSRFALNIVPKTQPEITTAMDEVQSDDVQGKTYKVIIHDKLYIILDGKMYDATGKCVKGGQK